MWPYLTFGIIVWRLVRRRWGGEGYGQRVRGKYLWFFCGVEELWGLNRIASCVHFCGDRTLASLLVPVPTHTRAVSV